MHSRRCHAGWIPKWSLPAALSVFVILLPVATGFAQSSPPTPEESSTASETDNGPAAPLPRGKKLILTDGSFQVVREYQRQGDRVRYYSVERSEWEEIPTSLVDWSATEKASAEIDTAQKETLEKIHAATASEVAVAVDTGSSLLVGSGVFLPDSPGFYVLDGQTVLGLSQVEAESRLDKGRAILKGISGIPLISTKRIIEVPGKRAKLRIESAEPEFYFRTADGRSPHITLVRTDVDGEKRHVTTAVIDMVGTTKYQQQEVPTMVSEAAHGVQRLTMGKKLEPGEYALLETTAEGLSSYIWDFGVDRGAGTANSKTSPSAPAAAKPTANKK